MANMIGLTCATIAVDTRDIDQMQVMPSSQSSWLGHFCSAHFYELTVDTQNGEHEVATDVGTRGQ